MGSRAAEASRCRHQPGCSNRLAVGAAVARQRDQEEACGFYLGKKDRFCRRRRRSSCIICFWTNAINLSSSSSSSSCWAAFFGTSRKGKSKVHPPVCCQQRSCILRQVHATCIDVLVQRSPPGHVQQLPPSRVRAPTSKMSGFDWNVADFVIDVEVLYVMRAAHTAPDHEHARVQ